MSVEEPDLYVQRISRLGNEMLGIEAMTEALPHVQLRIHTRFHQARVRDEDRTHVRIARRREEQRGRKPGEQLRRVPGEDQRVRDADTLEITGRRHMGL